MGTPVLARKATLEIKIDDNFVNVDGVTDISPDHQVSVADTTDHSSAAEKNIPDRQSMTLSVELNYMEDDDGQSAILDAVENLTQHEFRYRPQGNTSGATQETFTASVTGTPRSHANEGQATMSVSLQRSGDSQHGTISP